MSASVVTYGSAVPHLVFIMPGGGGREGGRSRDRERQGRYFAQLFPLLSHLCPLSRRNEKEGREAERERERGRKDGPPILSRLFLPLSRSLQTEQPAAAAASGAGSIHLERGKVDAMGDAAHAAAMLETV